MNQEIHDKASMMAAIASSRAAILQLVEGVPHDRLTARRDKEGWTAADHIAHLAAWERGVLYLINGESRAAGLQVGPDLFQSGDYDKINDAIRRQTDGHAAEAIISRWHNIHEQLIAKLEPLSEAQLSQSARKYSRDERSDRPLFALIGGNTVGHYREHLPQIAKLVGDKLPDWATLQPDRALAQLAGHDKPFKSLFRHGSLEVEIYRPQKVDKQQPHTRDELYVVISGTGTYRNGDHQIPFGPGDVLFAAAGDVHRFEEFTDDFATWVFFYGPEGGEAAQAPPA